MGGLLSTKNDPPPIRSYSYQPSPARTTFSSNDSYSYQPSRTTVNNNSSYRESYLRQQQERLRASRQQMYVQQESLNILQHNFENLRIAGARSTRTTQPPEKSVRKYNLFNISDNDLYNERAVVTFTQLPEWDSEYSTVTRMITNKRNFKVDSIEKIENMYLQKAFELKKEQKELTYGYVEERLLFHGTKKSNVDAICKFNFDWRRCKAHKYGKGVSFSPNSTYASNYSDEHVYNKIMIVAKVLVGRSCTGNQFMELPVEGCDTSQKGQDGIVIVKYEDNEFYPVYKINYHLMNENVGKGNKNARRGRRTKPIYVNNRFDDDIGFYFD